MLQIDIDGILSELSLAPPVTTVTNLLPEHGNRLNDRNKLKSGCNTNLLPVLPPLPPASMIPAEKCSDWQPVFYAWLDGEELRTTGVCDDLAGEISRLTADDLPLQRRLLKLHCGVYSGPWWGRLVERWKERTAIMPLDGGLSLADAEHQAAVSLRAVAFIEEMRGEP